MDAILRSHAEQIVKSAIGAVLPDEAVIRALEGKSFPGKVILVAAGKAAWQMAKAAYDVLGSRIDGGVVVTKYDHVMGQIPGVACREAGHPVPDENSFKGTQAALDLVSDLTEQDTVLFLLSGGGSALFEKPLVSGETLQDVTAQLLACGADIVEIRNYAFKNCASLTTINLELVDDIREGAFYGCSALEKITFSGENNLKIINQNAFENCDLEETLELPSICVISDYAFAGNQNLKGIVTGYALLSIGEYAFAYCWNLTDVTLPSSVTNLGQYVFYKCDMLTEITVPEGTEANVVLPDGRRERVGGGSYCYWADAAD